MFTATILAGITASIPNQGEAVAGFRAYDSIAISTPSGGYGLAIPPAMPFGEARAVAHLFANAPRIAAALRKLISECNAHLDYEDDEDMASVVEEAEEALAAAEGRA